MNNKADRSVSSPCMRMSLKLYIVVVVVAAAAVDATVDVYSDEGGVCDQKVP